MQGCYKKTEKIASTFNELEQESLKRAYQKSITIYDNKGFSLHNPQPARPGTKDNIVIRENIKTFSRGASRRMRKFLIQNKFKDKFHQFGLTLTIPGYPLNEKTLKKLFNRFRTNSKRMPFEFGAVARVETQARGQLHYHLICGVTTDNEDEIVKEMEKLWIKTLKAIGTIPKEHTGTFSEPIRIEPSEVTETFDYWQSIEDAYELNKSKAKRKFIYSKACQVELFPTQEYGNWLRYLNDHATKFKKDQIHSYNIRHWQIINKEAFERCPGERTILDDNLFFQICRWLSRMQTPIFKSKVPGMLFNKRKGRSFKHTGKSGLYNYFSNPATMQAMLNFVLERPPDTKSYLPT